MSAPKLEVTLVGASILRESELPGFEAVSDFASESYNLAIASLEASVRARLDLASRVHIHLLDFDVSWDDKTLGEAQARRVVDLAPDLLGLSCYCWSLHTLLDLSRRVRDALPHTFVVLGGPSAGPDAESLLHQHPWIDAVVRGEGEDAFAALLRARLESESLSTVPGLAWRSPSGEVVVNDLSDAPVDMQSLPSPYLSGVMRPVASSLFLETSRGCRFRCRFCSWMGGGRSLRYLPIAKVEANLRWAVEHDVRSVKLADTAINFHTERLEDLARALHRADPDRRLRLTYFLKPELLTEQQAAVLQSIPSDEVIIGVESLTPAARRAVGKPPFDPEAFEQRMRWLSHVGPVTASFILGLPGDSIEGFDNTLDWMLHFDAQHPGWLHEICLFWLAVLPGAALHDQRKTLGFRVMPRETPYALESHEHAPDGLLQMARHSIERHYGHPKLRVEYFHKEYLMQDAPVEDRKVSIPRQIGDMRPRVLLLGEVDPSLERRFDIRPYNLEIALLKTFLESDAALRRAWRVDIEHASPPPHARPGQMPNLAEPPPRWLLWSLRARPTPQQSASMRKALGPVEPTTLLHGANDPREARAWLQAVPWASMATVGEAERTMARLLHGQLDPHGLVVRRDASLLDTGPPDLVEDLDTIPSPFQWGLIQRTGSTIAMRLGRHDPLRTWSPERVYGDLRWAIEQRHDHIVWLDRSLPRDQSVLTGWLQAVRRADPDGKVRHSYRLDETHTQDSVREIADLPARSVRVATTDRAVREQIGRIARVWGARIVSEEPFPERLATSLLPLKNPGALSGWELQHLSADQGQVVASFQWQRNLPVVVRLRSDGIEPRRVQASVHLQGHRNPPKSEIERLTRVITALLGKVR